MLNFGGQNNMNALSCANEVRYAIDKKLRNVLCDKMGKGNPSDPSNLYSHPSGLYNHLNNIYPIKNIQISDLTLASYFGEKLRTDSDILEQSLILFAAVDNKEFPFKCYHNQNTHNYQTDYFFFELGISSACGNEIVNRLNKKFNNPRFAFHDPLEDRNNQCPGLYSIGIHAKTFIRDLLPMLEGAINKILFHDSPSFTWLDKYLNSQGIGVSVTTNQEDKDRAQTLGFGLGNNFSPDKLPSSPQLFITPQTQPQDLPRFFRDYQNNPNHPANRLLLQQPCTNSSSLFHQEPPIPNRNVNLNSLNPDLVAIAKSWDPYITR